MTDSLPEFELPATSEPAPQPPARKPRKPVKAPARKRKAAKKVGRPKGSRKAATVQVRRYVADKVNGGTAELDAADYSAIKYLAGLPLERRALIIMVANGLAK